LAGIRVIDFSMGWAGPLCTRQLADLGADVIKVEACQYPDWWRGVDPRDAFFAERRYEQDLRFAVMNRNKRGITLDLTSTEGVALLKQLVRGADAVVENYSPGVLPKLGLDYAALSAVKPDLVMVSMSAFGSRGPWSDARAYGSTLEHASGLPRMTGPADGPPVTNQLAYGDPIGGINGAAAVLVALLNRQRTRQGQHVDLSLVECLFPLVAPWMLEQSAMGSVGPRLGNRHPQHIPHGCFPCQGPNSWITVAVTDDAAWQALCTAIGRADLAARAELATVARRKPHQDEIEAALAEWTQEHSADSAMQTLQAAGIAAGAVRLPATLPQDPHLQARGFWQAVDRRYLGQHLQPSAPFRRQGAGPYPVVRAAPTLGEHNDAVLGDLLGLNPEAMARLVAAGITGQEAVPVSQRRSKNVAG
jgi:crotonobetainyl-CoA:carnitine CoA-transferase CaiB-like acyl-CoA transferase